MLTYKLNIKITLPYVIIKRKTNLKKKGLIIIKKIIFLICTLCIILIAFFAFKLTEKNGDTNLNSVILEDIRIENVDSIQCTSPSNSKISISNKEKISSALALLSKVNLTEVNGEEIQNQEPSISATLCENGSPALEISLLDKNIVSIVNHSDSSIKYYNIDNSELEINIAKNLYLKYLE